MLLIHLRNMSQLLTSKIVLPMQSGMNFESLIKYNKQTTDENFISSVDFLSQLVSPYKDSDYEEEIKKLLAEYKGKPLAESGRDFSIKKLGIVVRLMDRLNLLLEKEGKEKI